MADKKISQLTNAAPAIGTDELPINRAGTSGKLTITQITAIEKAERVAVDGALPSLTTTNKSNLVAAINEVNSSIAGKMPLSYLDIDPLLAANSDTKVASQKAVKAYITSVLPSNATETVKGIAEIATQAETNTGTDDTRFITPLKLKTNLTSLGYLGGAGTANYLPKYTASNTLGNSAIQQSATGNRILLNGVTDDTATAFQVNGSIRQTTVTNTLAALNSNGVLVSGGSGTTNSVARWTSSTTLGTGVLTDDGARIGIGVSPNLYSHIYAVQDQYTTGLNLVNDKAVSVSQTTVAISGSNTGDGSGTIIGIQGSAIATAGVTTAIGGAFTASNGGSNYALRLQDGTQDPNKFLKSIDIYGNANWSNITPEDIWGTTWHVPTASEFGLLKVYLGNDTTVGGKLKEVGTTHWTSPNTGATDIFNFSARQNGSRDATGFLYPAGTFWTAGTSVLYYINYNSSDLFITPAASTFGYGVRLVRNATKTELLLADGTNSITSPNSLLRYIGNDGTLYHTVKIGTQIWLKENLNESLYADGTAIPHGNNNTTWGALTSTGAWCYLDNLPENGPIYGKLYSYAVINSNNLVNTLQIQLNTGGATFGKIFKCLSEDGLANWVQERYVGEVYGGGVIFHVYKDANGEQHGLIVSINDQSTSSTYSNITTNIGASTSWDGQTNTNLIIAQGPTSGAAKICNDLISNGYSDWYLPSITELQKLYNNNYNVNKSIATISGAAEITPGFYWSSSQVIGSVTEGYFLNVFTGETNSDIKTQLFRVRAIRQF